MSDVSALPARSIPISIVSGVPAVEKQPGNDKIAFDRTGFDAAMPVLRYWTPEEFADLRKEGESMGFHHVASSPLVHSSCHADLQAHAAGVTAHV